MAVMMTSHKMGIGFWVRLGRVWGFKPQGTKIRIQAGRAIRIGTDIGIGTGV